MCGHLGRVALNLAAALPAPCPQPGAAAGLCRAELRRDKSQSCCSSFPAVSCLGTRDTAGLAVALKSEFQAAAPGAGALSRAGACPGAARRLQQGSSARPDLPLTLNDLGLRSFSFSLQPELTLHKAHGEPWLRRAAPLGASVPAEPSFAAPARAPKSARAQRHGQPFAT